MEQAAVQIKATIAATKLAASTAAVLLGAASVYVLMSAAGVMTGAPWDGYAYDYFAENYTVIS